MKGKGLYEKWKKCANLIHSLLFNFQLEIGLVSFWKVRKKFTDVQIQ